MQMADYLNEDDITLWQVWVKMSSIQQQL
jgi:hypothetical protein